MLVSACKHCVCKHWVCKHCDFVSGGNFYIYNLYYVKHYFASFVDLHREVSFHNIGVLHRRAAGLPPVSTCPSRVEVACLSWAS